MKGVRDEISGDIELTFAQETRRNEHRVAAVRVFAWSLIFLIDSALILVGQRPSSYFLSGIVTLGIAVIGLLLVQRRYRASYGFTMPVVDAFLLGHLLETRFLARGAAASLLSTGAIGCALFASTGGLRFDRKSNLWTTFLAVAVFLFTIGRRSDLATSLYGMTGLAAIGSISIWVTGLLQRSIRQSSLRIVMSRFVPRSLRDLADPLGVIGEPRELEGTVLVSDLRGFTSIAEKMKPRDVLAYLNEIQGELADVVEKNGGIVDKFMGDGMLAVFGATAPTDGHAARAIEAAMEIRRRVTAVNARNALPVRIGIGIHTGPLVAGCIGSGARLEFTVIGDAVNIASRVESLTKDLGKDVLVTETAARAAGRDLPHAGRVVIRGRTNETTLHSLPDEDAAVTADRGSAPRTSP